MGYFEKYIFINKRANMLIITNLKKICINKKKLNEGKINVIYFDPKSII